MVALMINMERCCNYQWIWHKTNPGRLYSILVLNQIRTSVKGSISSSGPLSVGPVGSEGPGSNPGSGAFFSFFFSFFFFANVTFCLMARVVFRIPDRSCVVPARQCFVSTMSDYPLHTVHLSISSRNLITVL